LELTASGGVGALESSLPEVSLASSEKGLAGPAEGRCSVGHWLGRKGVLGDEGATAIRDVGEGSGLEEDSGAIDIIEIIAGKVRQETEVIHKVAIMFSGEWDNSGVRNI
jgi:hypothetical protein